MKHLFRKSHLLIFAVLFGAFIANGQQRPFEPSLESPHATIYTHLFYLQSDNYRPGIAARTIPIDIGLDSIQRVRAAIRIKRIYDGLGLYVRVGDIPKNTNYRDSSSNNLIYTPFPKRLPEVYVEKIGEDWFYSEETLRQLPELYREVYPLGADFLINLFPESGHKEFLGLELWQYVWIAILLIFAFLIVLLIELVIRPLISRILDRKHFVFQNYPKLFRQLTRVTSLIIAAYGLKLMIPSLQLEVKATQFLQSSFSVFLTVLVSILLFRLAQVLTAYLERWAERTEHKMDDQAIPILDRVLKSIIVIGAILTVLSVLKVNITALLAGISIGGLALALAAKDTVQNLIGSLMIFVDRPFQIGDFVEGNDFVGEIVEVGFRSTRIMNKDTSIISVPNGVLANLTIKNYGLRIFRLFEARVGVTYSTTPEQIETYVNGLRQLADDHPKITESGRFIVFETMADSSLNVLFRVYLDTDSYAEELMIKEELYLIIMRMAKSLGIEFAFPSTSLYVEQMPTNGDVMSEEDSEDHAKKLDAFMQQVNEKLRGKYNEQT
jgi:MscS family membrane protein